MRKVRFIRHDQDREDQKQEERAERKAMFDDDAPEDVDRFELDPDITTVESFADFLYGEDRDTYDHRELREMCARTQQASYKVKDVLATYGLTQAKREHEKKVRGFNSNPHTLFTDLGMNAGSGGSAIMGLAGNKG